MGGLQLSPTVAPYKKGRIHQIMQITQKGGMKAQGTTYLEYRRCTSSNLRNLRHLWIPFLSCHHHVPSTRSSRCLAPLGQRRGSITLSRRFPQPYGTGGQNKNRDHDVKNRKVEGGREGRDGHG